MRKKKNHIVGPGAPESKPTTPVPESFMNSFAETIGLGGGVNPMGYPFNQYAPGSTTVENVGTIFKNLRWYLISNMRQVLNQAYVEFGLVQTIVDVPVDDALRGGVQIKSQQLEENQIEQLKASLDRDDDLNTAGQAAKWNRLFGGAGIIILTDQDPEEPLDLDQIGPDDPLEFRAVDMWELFWDKQNTEGYDPTIQEEDFEHYNYYGEQIHKSRVMRLKGLTAPSFIRPRLRGWGFSVVEILVRSINQYLKGTDLAFEVLDEFKVDVFKISGLTQALASPIGVDAIKKRVQLANWEKNYNNALTMDKEDDCDHKQLSFSGLGDAMMQIRMQVASDMRMPLTKLFGISAAGFNSGEDDIEVYNSMVESQVRNKIKYSILRIIEIKCQKLFGFVPDDIQISFEPLRYMSSEQEETVKTQKFTRLQTALQAGAISLKEFREACNKGELFDITVDVEDESLLDGYMADQVEAGDTESEIEGDDDPGASRIDTARPTAGSKGGIPTDGPVKPEAKTKNSKLLIMPRPYSTAQRATRAVTNSATFDRKSYEADGGDGWIDPRRRLLFDRNKAQDPGLWDKAVAASRDSLGDVRWQFVVWFYKKYGGRFGQIQNSDKWKEDDHPRAEDGKFGKGGGGAKTKSKPKPKREINPAEYETIEVGGDGDGVADLSDEQIAMVKERFREAAHGPDKKNPATETADETSERQHKLEKEMRDKATTKERIKGKLDPSADWKIQSSFHVDDLTIHGDKGVAEKCDHCGKGIKTCVVIDGDGKRKVGLDCAEALTTGEAKQAVVELIQKESKIKTKSGSEAKELIKRVKSMQKGGHWGWDVGPGLAVKEKVLELEQKANGDEKLFEKDLKQRLGAAMRESGDDWPNAFIKQEIKKG